MARIYAVSEKKCRGPSQLDPRLRNLEAGYYVVAIRASHGT